MGYVIDYSKYPLMRLICLSEAWEDCNGQLLLFETEFRFFREIDEFTKMSIYFGPVYRSFPTSNLRLNTQFFECKILTIFLRHYLRSILTGISKQLYQTKTYYHYTDLSGQNLFEYNLKRLADLIDDFRMVYLFNRFLHYLLKDQ